MSDTGWHTVTGHGLTTFALPSTPVRATDIEVVVTDVTSPRVRFVDAFVPRRLQYAGSVGISAQDVHPVTAADIQMVVAEVQINFEYMDFYFVPGQQSVDSFWWKLPAGVTAQLRLFYI